MKYIDAERLRKEVKIVEKAAHKSALGCADSETRKFHEGKDFAYQYVGILIDSLQQEQPEVFDSAAFQLGVQEGRRLEREDAEHLRDATKKISEDLEDAK